VGPDFGIWVFIREKTPIYLFYLVGFGGGGGGAGHCRE